MTRGKNTSNLKIGSELYISTDLYSCYLIHMRRIKQCGAKMKIFLDSFPL